MVARMEGRQQSAFANTNPPRPSFLNYGIASKSLSCESIAGSCGNASTDAATGKESFLGPNIWKDIGLSSSGIGTAIQQPTPRSTKTLDISGSASVSDKTVRQEDVSRFGSRADGTTPWGTSPTCLPVAPAAWSTQDKMTSWGLPPMGPNASHQLQSNRVSPSRPESSSSALSRAQTLFDEAAASQEQYYQHMRLRQGEMNSYSSYTFHSPAAKHGDAAIGASAHRMTATDVNTTPSPTSPWADLGSLHYSPDGRRSAANSDYFNQLQQSAPGSRNSSLPPSRHGVESGALSRPDDLGPFGPASQQPSVRVPNSASGQINGRSFHNNINSYPNDGHPMLNRSTLDSGIDGSSNGVHKSTLSFNGVRPFPTAQGSQDSVSRYVRASLPDISQPFDNGVYSSFASDGFPAGNPQINSQIEQASFQQQYRNGAAGDRGGLPARNGIIRRGPFYASRMTPPPSHEQVHHRHNSPSLSSTTTGASAPQHRSPSHGTAGLEREFRGLELEPGRSVAAPSSTQHSSSIGHGYVVPHSHGSYSQMYTPPPQFGRSSSSSSMQGNGFAPPYHPQQAAMPLQHMRPVETGHLLMPMIQVDIPKGPREQDANAGLRSALLEEFINSPKSRRWELKDIYDHIVEFSGHQLASRFIQQKLETAKGEEKDRVFREIQQNSMQLMTDVFGNYVIQKFFEHGDQNQKKVLASRMEGHILGLSLQMYGCRVVQKALEHILTDQQASLIQELQGSVLRCVKDQNGNHVIQKAIERIPAEHIEFIIDAFVGQVGQLAKHSYGCRVIQRMLERCDMQTKRRIMKELHEEGDRLIADQYGNYVTQHVIQHGEPEDRTKVIAHVSAQILHFSKHKFASNVVEKCLLYGTPQQRHDMMVRILELCPKAPGATDNDALFMLLKDGYGNYVVQKLLDTVEDADFAVFVQKCQPEMNRVKQMAQTKQVQALDRKMHTRKVLVTPPHPLSLPTGLRPGGLTPANRSPTSDTPGLDLDDSQSLRSLSLPSQDGAEINLPLHPQLNGKPPVVDERLVFPEIGPRRFS